MLQQRPIQIVFHPNAINATGRSMQWILALIELPINKLSEKIDFDFSVTTEDRHKRPWYKHYLHS